MIDCLCVLFVGDGVCLGVRQGNTQDWKLMWGKARKDNNTKTYATNGEIHR